MPATEIDTDILVATIGGHQVTMTHRQAGTVLVGSAAYRHFRKIIVEREILDWHDNQSEVLSELGVCIDNAVWLKKRDKRGNMMLLDRENDVLFIIDATHRVLCCVYDYRNRLEKKAVLPPVPGKRAA